MSLPPRQSRPLPAVDAPRRPTDQPIEPKLTFQQVVQRALETSRLPKIPRIPDPGGFAYVPWLGPAWETAVDLQDGDYAGAGVNALMFATEFTPAGPLRRVGKLVKEVNKMRRGRLLASANTQSKRIRKIEQEARELAGNAEAFEVHHSFPMKGAAPTSREARRIEGLLRNHPANLKILPKHLHHGVHHGFGNPYTDPVLKAWHGTNDLHKAAAAATGAVAADSVENAVSAKPADAGKAAIEPTRPILDPKRGLDVRRTEQGFIISHKR